MIVPRVSLCVYVRVCVLYACDTACVVLCVVVQEPIGNSAYMLVYERSVSLDVPVSATGAPVAAPVEASPRPTVDAAVAAEGDAGAASPAAALGPMLVLDTRVRRCSATRTMRCHTHDALLQPRCAATTTVHRSMSNGAVRDV